MEQLPERVNPGHLPARPTRHIPEAQLNKLVEENGLSVGQSFWAGIAEVPSDQPLVTTNKAGERRLAISAVRDVLEAHYATKGAAGWPRVGKKTLYTLNLLATYLGESEGDPDSDAYQHPDTYADPSGIATFCKASGIPATKDLISATVQRIGAATITERYGEYTKILPEGKYTAEDTTFAIRDSLPYSRVEVESVGIQSVLAGITDIEVLHTANAHPRVHYALLKWFSPLLRKSSTGASEVVRKPPEHSAIRPEFAPLHVSSEQYDGLLEDKTLIQENIRRSYIVSGLQRAIAQGLFYPLTGLIVTDGERSALYGDRVARFLTSMIRSNQDELPRTTLISGHDFKTLAELDLKHGSPEELPVAKTTEASWHDGVPAITLRGLVDFGRDLGRDVDTDDMRRLMNGVISAMLRERHQYTPGEVFIHDGAVYEYLQHNNTSFVSAADVETRGMTVNFAKEHFTGFAAKNVVSALIFAKYIKAATQQS